MMQITLLSLQFLLIILTIEGRELFRISDDGLGGFRQEDSSREVTVHSMASANLKKSEEFVTNTTAASKYIPRRPKISIN